MPPTRALPPTLRRPAARVGTLGLALTIALTGCTAGAETDESGASESRSPAESHVPVPGSTALVDPSDAAAVDIPPELHLSVVLPPADLASDLAGRDASLRAIEEFARDHAATVTVFSEGSADDLDALLQSAVLDGGSMVITIGSDMLAALDRVTASTIDQQFLLIGAELPEPTENVTAVIWPGADAREILVAGPDGRIAEGSVIGARAPEAIEQGIAAVVDGRTGGVLDLGE